MEYFWATPKISSIFSLGSFSPPISASQSGAISAISPFDDGKALALYYSIQFSSYRSTLPFSVFSRATNNKYISFIAKYSVSYANFYN